jgi:purine-binding chemotaxis protein CheW
MEDVQHSPASPEASLGKPEPKEAGSDVAASTRENLPERSAPANTALADEKKRILRERALKLARKPEAEEARGALLEIIEFGLADERYAIEVEFVREVCVLKDLTPVPCTPSFILGIINVRGQVISVTDVRDFFDLPKKEMTESTRVLILKNRSMEMGILAESVVGQRKIPIDSIQSNMPALAGIREHYIKGVTSDRLVIISGDKLLSDDNIVVHQEVGD